MFLHFGKISGSCSHRIVDVKKSVLNLSTCLTGFLCFCITKLVSTFAYQLSTTTTNIFLFLRKGTANFEIHWLGQNANSLSWIYAWNVWTNLYLMNCHNAPTKPWLNIYLTVIKHLLNHYLTPFVLWQKPRSHCSAFE